MVRVRERLSLKTENLSEEIWVRIVQGLSDAETLELTAAGDSIRAVLIEERFHAFVSPRFLRKAIRAEEAAEHLERSVMWVNELESRWQALGPE